MAKCFKAHKIIGPFSNSVVLESSIPTNCGNSIYQFQKTNCILSIQFNAESIMVKKSMKTTAIIGFISKGFIYVVIGVLSLLAALNMGGESSGTNSALLFLKKQIFGQLLLTALAVGLLCYSFLSDLFWQSKPSFWP